jgi:hypothetical protein
VLGIQALIPGITSSSDESTAPDAPRTMAMTNGRMRNPPRSAFIAECNRTGKRAIVRMPNEFNNIGRFAQAGCRDHHCGLVVA